MSVVGLSTYPNVIEESLRAGAADYVVERYRAERRLGVANGALSDRTTADSGSNAYRLARGHATRWSTLGSPFSSYPVPGPSGPRVLVDRSGGEVRIEDNHPEGTVFVVSPPVAPGS